MATVEGYPADSSVSAGGAIVFHLSATYGVPGARSLGVDRVWPAAGPLAVESATLRR